MSRGPGTFRQRDVTRALKAAKAAGMAVDKALIRSTGDIVLMFGEGTNLDYHGPLQSPYRANKEAAQSIIEENLALSEDAANPGSKGGRASYLEERGVAIHKPSFLFHDTTDEQQEFERLAANVQSVQREEAAAQCPRASPLPPVSGLAPVSDRVWPSLEPEYLIRSRDNLRGPRTMIKIILLIASIFTVPIAYYFWMGGWDPIPRGPTELASFDSESIRPPRMPSREGVLPGPRPEIMPSRGPSSEEGTTTARGGDLGTPAKGEPRTAKSSPAEFVATFQPSTPGAQASSSSMAARA